ncbi:MAG TPA: discoidin domain-containing protein [Planctomycetota bacterium]|nr:discoidin domain-containing protein [Planctomycetota bacterium]
MTRTLATILAISLICAVALAGTVRAGEPQFPEIPSDRMTASASSAAPGCGAAKAIDCHPDDAASWLANAPEAWLRINLGSRYLVTGLAYQPRQAKPDGRIRQCAIYVTDSTSDNTDDWGCPVWRRELPNTGERQDLKLEYAVGRYVIVAAESAHEGVAGVNEIQVYGACDFAVVNPATGCPVRANSRMVNVAIFNLPMPPGKTATRFQITQGPAGSRDDPPPEPQPPTVWLDSPPKTFTIQAKPPWTNLVFHAWAKDSADPPTIVRVARPFAFTITRSSPDPKNITVRATPPDNTAVVTVDDIDRGSWHYGGRIIGRTISCTQDATPDDRTVTLPGPGDYVVTLTVLNDSGTYDSEECTVIVLPAGDEHRVCTWTAGADAANRGWSNPQNWLGGAPDASAIAGFTAAGPADAGPVISLLDPPGDAWTIGGLTAADNSREHTVDLAGKRLVVDGHVNLGYGSITAPLTFANGTLQIGTPRQPRNLIIAYKEGYRAPEAAGSLIIEDAAFDPHLDLCAVGWGTMTGGGTGVLDLRTARLTGAALRAHDLHVGLGFNGYLKIAGNRNPADPNSPGIAAIEVANDLFIGTGHGTGRIGDPDNYGRLPEGINITIGTWGVHRGRFRVGQGGWGGADGRLLARSGGSFTAYLSLIDLADASDPCGPGTHYPLPLAIVDLQAMDSVKIDATTVRIAAPTPSGANRNEGYMYLPRGTFAVDDLRVHHPDVTDFRGTGVLTMNGTLCTVRKSLILGPRGRIDARVCGSSAGLDIAADAIVEVTAGGRINLSFDAPAESVETDAGPARPYCALRWEGDHLAALRELADSGRLAWESIVTPITIFCQGGCTFVGLQPDLPRIGGFSLVDRLSGRPDVTHSDTVNVAVATEPGAAPIAGCMITDTAAPPDPNGAGWLAAFPATIQLPDKHGQIQRFAWVKDARGAVAGRRADIQFNAPPIDKSRMIATASSARAGHPPQDAIDGSPGGPGWLAESAAGNWLRVDLGARYAVAMFAFDPAAGAAITEYEVYVTDSRGPDSGTVGPADPRKQWGQPVAAGKWNPASGESAPRVVFPSPKAGRFLVLYVLTAREAAGVAEFWMALQPLAP